MPGKASGEPKVKTVERARANGDIYFYEVITLYNPQKRYNEHVSRRLLGKNPLMAVGSYLSGRSGFPGLPPLPLPSAKLSGLWISLNGSAANPRSMMIYVFADRGTAQKIISIARFWMANPDKTIRRIEEWQILHVLPYEEGLSEDTC